MLSKWTGLYLVLGFSLFGLVECLGFLLVVMSTLMELRSSNRPSFPLLGVFVCTFCGTDTSRWTWFWSGLVSSPSLFRISVSLFCSAVVTVIPSSWGFSSATVELWVESDSTFELFPTLLLKVPLLSLFSQNQAELVLRVWTPPPFGNLF